MWLESLSLSSGFHLPLNSAVTAKPFFHDWLIPVLLPFTDPWFPGSKRNIKIFPTVSNFHWLIFVQAALTGFASRFIHYKLTHWSTGCVQIYKPVTRHLWQVRHLSSLHLDCFLLHSTHWLWKQTLYIPHFIPLLSNIISFIFEQIFFSILMNPNGSNFSADWFMQLCSESVPG